MKYISAGEVAKLVKDKNKVPGKDYLIVDVRDDDFAGGHIKGALNQPSGEFLASVDLLVSKTKDVPLVIFHCALSQVRGPKSARIYEEVRLQNIDRDIEHEVVVLGGGFSVFQGMFKDDAELVEDWDKEAWEPEFVDDTVIAGWTYISKA